MSQICDEVASLYRETPTTARQEHRCGACEEKIAKGTVYYNVVIMGDGHAWRVKRCQRCQTIHEFLRTKCDGDEWPDEWLDCGHDYSEVWSEDPPEHIAALAFALPHEKEFA